MFKTRFTILLLAFFLSLTGVPAKADTIDDTTSSVSFNQVFYFANYFTAFVKALNPELSKETNINRSVNANQLSVLKMGFANLQSTIPTGSTSVGVQDFSNVEAAVIGPALVYPNPFQQAKGGIIGYQLSKNVDIQLQIYDIFSNRIFNGSFAAGSEGAKYGYNKVRLDLDSFGGYQLSAGVYFYVLVSGGKVLSKGKMAVIP
ncbi:MAG: T9SS type A sorting domain-containing protein [Candidatus Margulisiibacteriota bacterium]